MDTPGPYETVAKEAFFNVTIPEKSWTPEHTESFMGQFNYGTILSTAIHEAYPGHYVQFLWMPRIQSRVRKLLGASSNAEGWAHYCEQMMLDEGYSKDPKMRLGQLQDALLRDARYIVGIEMHTGKRTFDQAIEFFVQEGYQPHEVARGRNQARHGRRHLSLLHAGEAANPEAARRLQENARQPVLVGGISRPFSAAGIPAHQDRAQGDAGQRFADALVGRGFARQPRFARRSVKKSRAKARLPPEGPPHKGQYRILVDSSGSLSPEDTFPGVQEHFDDYIAMGVPNIWVLDPPSRRSWRATREGHFEALDGMLKTNDPRIEMRIADLFPLGDQSQPIAPPRFAIGDTLPDGQSSMMNRRNFIKDSAGIAFTSCALLDAARAQQPARGRRREVSIGGKRIKTIDVHAHATVPEAHALMGKKPSANESMASGSIDDRLRTMDQQGIDVEAISINPFWYGAERDVARRVIQLQNEKLAALCATHPDRFVGYATVALQFPDLATQQLEDGVKKLGLRGGSIGCVVNGDELGARKFDPFWAKAQELDVLLFMHPSGTPDLAKRLQGNGLLTNVIGNPLDTTIALSHLIFDGTLDRFPRLKLCAAHGGGYLGSYADRSDHGCLTFPEACKPFTPLKKKPTEYVRQLYFDSLVFTPEALRHLVAQAGATQIMIGTDYPYPWVSTPVDQIMGTSSLSTAEREMILGGTAAKLLKIS